MALEPGSKLGPYEIVGPLGAGGMGEVYRAKDLRLGRDVAVKILPTHLSDKPDVRERFEREARAISSLNHPNICTLYDIGREGDADYFVMELLDGESLSARLARGPLRVDEALKIGAQVAEGLAAAHKQGIIHRDLKPGNIGLTKSGAKVLDFGVAKLRDEAVVDMATRTTPLTSAGAMVGTVQYMAPEQLEGRPVDHRADLFAFGALLHEMLTGQRAFPGQSQASVIAAILTLDPRPVSELVPTAPAALDRVIKSCLAKEADERWQSASDLARELKWIADGRSLTTSGTGAATVVPRRRGAPSWVIALALAAVAAAAAILGWMLHRPLPAPIIRSSIVLPPGAELDSDNASIELSPDGMTLAYAAREQSGPLKLWVRPLSGLSAQALAGTDNATYPFWSSDGHYLGFFADRKLKKVPAAGGAVQTICAAEEGRGASWGANDVIVFSPNIFAGLFQVPASGGMPTTLTTIKEEQLTHRNPHFLPGGKTLLYFGGKPVADATNGVYALDLATKTSHLILAVDSAAKYVEPGYLIFVKDGNLLAQPFDAASQKLSGEAVPIAEKIQFNANRRTGTYAVANNGFLVYLSDPIQRTTQLTWYDLEGKTLGPMGDPSMFWFQMKISPDDKMATVSVRKPEGGSELVVYDLARGAGRRLPSAQTDSVGPVFSPDGKSIVCRDLPGYFWIRSTDGVAPSRKLSVEAYPLGAATDWSPDGSTIFIWGSSPKNAIDIETIPVNGDGKAHPIIATQANEQNPAISRDGKWLTYTSDESGRSELYITPFPGPGGKWPISTDGAVNGGWLGNGNEVWYTNESGHFFAVPLTIKAGAVDVGTRRPLFAGQPLRSELVDFTHDGKRALAAVPPVSTSGPALTLVTNWASELKAK